MQRILNAFIEMLPCPKERARVTKKGFSYTPQKTKDAEELISNRVSSLMTVPPIEATPLSLLLTVHKLKPKSKKQAQRPIGRPDIDNYAKLVADALNGIVWVDDSQIVEMHCCKIYSERQGLHIQVFTLS